MNITVLGCGRWGSFIAWYQATVLKNNVTLYGEEGRPAYDVLRETGRNEYVKLDKSITLTSDLGYALGAGDVIIISISSQALREFMQKVIKHPVADKTFVLCMKGIEEGTGKRLSEVLTESGIKGDHIAVWVGPGHIQAFLAGVPNCMVIDSTNRSLKEMLANSFKSNLIRFYYGNDIIGTEVGAAAKNVTVTAADISEDALALAAENARANGAEIKFVKSDLLLNVRGKFNLIVCNPPYIRRGDIAGLAREVRDFEPVGALDGGEDGLDFYRRLAKEAPKHLVRGGTLLMECGEGQAQEIVRLFSKFDYTIISRDYNDVERFVRAVL